MRRLALLACAVAFVLAAPAAWADDVTPAPSGTVTGVVFQDMNGDGVGPQPGEGVLAGWVVWADLDGNGARDASDPSATAGPDGRYTLGPLAAGNYTLVIQPPDGSPCPQNATCTRPAAVADATQTTVDFPIAQPAAQLIDEEPVRVGLVKLTMPRGCRRKAFTATLTGSSVTRVDFRIDGRLVRSQRAPRKDGSFSVTIDPRRVRRGRHTLTAAVWFSKLQTKPQKQVSATFSSCARSR